MISSYFRFASFDRQFGRFADFLSFVETSSEKKGNEIDDGVDKTVFGYSRRIVDEREDASIPTEVHDAKLIVSEMWSTAPVDKGWWWWTMASTMRRGEKAMNVLASVAAMPTVVT